MKKYNFGVVIGRFRPFHNGHAALVTKALEIAEKVIVIVGSKNSPIDWKNPWNDMETITMLRAVYKDNPRVYFSSVEDKLYEDNVWVTSVYEEINNVITQYTPFNMLSADSRKVPKIVLVGFNKDESSNYIYKFNWDLVEADIFNYHQNDVPLSSTHLRELLFSDKMGFIKHYVPEAVYDYIIEWSKSDAFSYVKDWYLSDIEYQKPYLNLKYGSNFYCADNVVVQSGHVLLIRRRFHPGKDLWALPGGHIQTNEDHFDAAIRELREETGIKVPEKVLRGSLKKCHIFDHPCRSLRGRLAEPLCRTISIAHYYELDDSMDLPRVTPADDASEAWWFNFLEVKNMKANLFEDHHSIISFFLN